MIFYKVKLCNVEHENYFVDYENAANFLLNAYFDDTNDVTDEDGAMDINNEVADTGAIEGYGCIEECWFDD